LLAFLLALLDELGVVALAELLVPLLLLLGLAAVAPVPNSACRMLLIRWAVRTSPAVTCAQHSACLAAASSPAVMVAVDSSARAWATH
jgi:hypothetical protein